jgi:chromate transporter
VGTIAVTVFQLVPHAAPDVFSAAVLLATVAALLAWRLPVIALVVAGGLIGILARSRFIQRLI